MIKRRRVLSILAGVAALPIVGARASGSIADLGNVVSWRGIALGAEAQLILDHPEANRLISGAVEEIHRLEQIFSLYLADSQLSQLNRDGVLEQPSFEMVELLSISAALNKRTNGAFDPSVQTLWSLYARSFSAGSAPGEIQISEALERTGWEHVSFSPSQVSFDRRGVNLTLNGIAQGFIADKIANYFRANGVENVLVNTGEISGLGLAPNGDFWRVNFGHGGEDKFALHNMAIATSAPLGTVFDVTGKTGHILDPRTGYPGANWSEVSVVTHSACEADGLSTAFCLMNRAEIDLAKASAQVYVSS